MPTARNRHTRLREDLMTYNRGRPNSCFPSAIVLSVQQCELKFLHIWLYLHHQAESTISPVILTKRLLAGAVQNAKVRGGIMPTLPFVSSSVSTTPEREDGDHIELLAEANLRAIGASQRTSMPIITSATTTTPIANPAAIAKEKLIGSFVFGADSPSAGESHPIPGGFSDCIGSDCLIGEYNIKEMRRLNSIVEEKDALLKAKDEEVGILKAQLVLKETEAAEAIPLRTEASNFEAVEKCLQTSVKVREQEVADLDVVVTSVKLQNDNLVDQVNKLETSSAGLQEKVTAYLMVPIHHSLDQRVIGASALSLSLDVYSSRVRRINENIAKHRSALRNVFVPLSEPLSVTALTGTKSTLDVIPATVDTTTALSVTPISASLIPLISTDDYEVAHAEGGDSVGVDVNLF
nr:hypothetical protein [Tanacetum cinerariifolium]